MQRKLGKKAYLAIKKDTFQVFCSCFMDDVVNFVGVDVRTFKKYLDNGEYKGWIFKYIPNLRVKKQ